MRTRSKRAGAKYQAQAQLDSVKAKVVPAVYEAVAGAREGASTLVTERVVPTVQAARDSAVPAAQSAVASAREKAAPVVADARDRVVDDLLPRLAAAATAASAAAAAARDNALESAQETAAQATKKGKKKAAKATKQAKKNLPANKQKRRRRRFLLLTIIAAAVAAAVAASRQKKSESDWTPASTGSVNGATHPAPPAPMPEASPGPVLAPPPVVDDLQGAGAETIGDPLTDPLVEDPEAPAQHPER